jgi:hypothetical protein
MFITVDKIVPEIAKDRTGEKVIDKNGRPVVASYDSSKELIRLDEIKSARSWHKDAIQSKHFEGDLTMVYLYGDKKVSREPAKMIINESLESFSKRSGSK